MTIYSALSVLSALAAALLVSGCFVISANVPAGSGPINDEALVGDWRGLEEGSDKATDVYVHFQRPDADKPLRVVFVEDRSYQIYELITRVVGKHKVFAAKIVAPVEAKKDTPEGFFLGFYEVNGDEAVFHLLDSEKTNALIRQGKVSGKAGKAKYDYATLDGSKTAIAEFLSTPEAWAARADPARLRRLPSAKN
jgi:hypothetical protein